MNFFQKILLTFFLAITSLILILDNFYPNAAFVSYIKFTVISLMCLIALTVEKKYFEQRLLTVSIVFIFIGDIFFVLCGTLFIPSPFFAFFGILSFTIAYIFVITAFRKKARLGLVELLASLPIIALTLPVVVAVFPYVAGLTRWGLLLFVCLLCYTSWTCVCTVFHGYFALKSAYRIALAGLLMLICDLGVGVSLFHPAYNQQFVPWLKNIIWGTYIPAWTLILVIIIENNLRKNGLT